MTEQLEDIPTMTATERLVQILEREDSTAWEKTDAAKDAIEDGWDDRATRDHHDHTKTGLHARIADVWENIVDADVPEPPNISTVAKWYAAALAWPGETRVDGASYRAHVELVGGHWRDRQGALSKLVDKNRKRNGPTAIVSGEDVRLWKQTQTPPPQAKPWEEKFWGRLDSLVHSRIGPQTKDEWGTAIKLVKTLLDDMREEAENAE